MRIRLGVLSFLLPVLLFGLSFSQEPISHEEQYVRTAYAELDFATQLGAVTPGALDEVATGKSQPPAKLVARMVKNHVTFNLKDFRVGNLAEIADVPWSTVRTGVTPETHVIAANIIGQGYQDESSGARWKLAEAKWEAPGSEVATQAYTSAMAMSVSKTIDSGGQYFRGPGVVYTRFAAFTATAQLDGKTVGPYQALFLFGRDEAGLEVVSPQDPFVTGGGLAEVSKDRLYPAGLLRTRLRDTRIVANWLPSQAVSDNRCSAGKDELCCPVLSSGVKCGLSSIDLQRELSAPLVAPLQ